MSKRRLLIVELNEFNEKLLEKGANFYKLRNIKRLLKMKSSQTESLDEREHHGLDPWVQWVSIHTGVPHEKHGIDHLADVHKLKYSQIWEEIGENGFSSGIWGAMNSSLKQSKKCCFFMPDPWTYSENAKPKKLNNFLALPRYYSKSYLSLSFKKILKNSSRLIYFFLFQFNSLSLFIELKIFLKYFLRIGLNVNFLFAIFDLISTKVFLSYKKKYDPNLSIIFLNCLAHAQHEVWGKNNLNKDISMTLKIVDNILGSIFQELKSDEGLIILNALGQKNVEGEKYCIYRQKDPKSFLKSQNISFLSLEQCMTNESHVFFKNVKEKEKAYKILSETNINGKKIFHVEKYDNQPKKLFYQFDFFESLEKNAKFLINGSEYKFNDYFSLLGQRTGAHIPYGKAFYSKIKLNDHLYNHEIYNYILDFYKQKSI